MNDFESYKTKQINEKDLTPSESRSKNESFSFDFSSINEKYIELNNEANKEATLKNLYPTSVDLCTIAKFDQEKGFGFLKQGSSKDNIFFHVSNYYSPNEQQYTKKTEIIKERNRIKSLLAENNSVTSLITTYKEKGLASEKWCFSEEAKLVIDEKIKELVSSKIKEKIEQEIISQINPEIIGDGDFTFTIDQPLHSEKKFKIKPIIKEENNNYVVNYETSLEDKLSKVSPIQFPEGIHVIKDGLIADSIDSLKNLEETYIPLESNQIFLEKDTTLPKELKKERNSGYPLYIKNMHDLLLRDPQTTIETQKFINDILSEYYSGSSIDFINPKLQGKLSMHVGFARLGLSTENDFIGEKATERKINLPYLNSLKDISKDDLKELTTKLFTEDFRSKIEEGVEKFMRKNYSLIVTTKAEQIFTGSFYYSIKIKTVLPPFSPFAETDKQINTDNNIELTEKKWAEEAWNRIDREMRESEIEKVNKTNKELMSSVFEKQKNDRESYSQNPSEIIGDRYVVKKEKDGHTFTSRNDGFTYGSKAETITYFDLKTGSILFQEEDKTEYRKSSYTHTLGGDGWRRGMQVSGNEQGSFDTKKYILCDKKFEDIFYKDKDKFEKQKDIILKNLEKIKQGNSPDEEFIDIIKEIEKQRENEKELFKEYLGESFQDIDKNFEEYLKNAKQILAKKE